jgi:mRNA interferase MazF
MTNRVKSGIPPLGTVLQMMRRGEIRWVDMNPSKGSEASKRRPAVLVSNDAANSTASRLGRGVVTIVPITSNVERIYPFQVHLNAGPCGLSTDSKAQAEQVRSVSVERVGSVLGTVPPQLMQKVDDALRLHLAL